MQAFSVYKGIVLLGQIVMTYVGFVIVSVLDTYHYKGILWAALKAGNVWVTIVALVWISLTFPAIRWLWSMLRHKGLRKRELRKLI